MRWNMTGSIIIAIPRCSLLLRIAPDFLRTNWNADHVRLTLADKNRDGCQEHPSNVSLFGVIQFGGLKLLLRKLLVDLIDSIGDSQLSLRVADSSLN